MMSRFDLTAFLGKVLGLVVGIALLVGAVKLALLARSAIPDEALDPAGPGASRASAERVESAMLPIPDSLHGKSGALRFAALTMVEAQSLDGFLEAFGDTILAKPSILASPSAADTFAFMLMRPFADKRGEFVGRYRLGLWPAERWMMATNYFNPDGFVEVYPQHVDIRLSAHFRLGDFLTRDQADVWPKYVVLEEKLIDKLELVVAELHARRHDVRRVVVLSGFRAPYYNEKGIDEGAARASRHQYGDAADIIVDNDGDGSMDDLNRDGRVNLADARLIGAAASAVERRFPGLTGGLGTYAAMGPSGPFAHVDVRGTSARWNREQRRQEAGGRR